MPPQVGRAGDGSKPVVQNAGEGVQEVKSSEVERNPLKGFDQIKDRKGK